MGIEVSPFKSGDRCNAGASHWIDAHQANILPSDRKLVAQPGPGSPTVIDSSWAYHSASSARGGCASLVADVRCQIPCSQDGECCAEFECDVVLDWRIGPLSIYKPYFMRAAYFVPEPEDQTQPCFCTIPECEVKIVDQRVFDLFATFPARETSC